MLLARDLVCEACTIVDIMSLSSSGTWRVDESRIHPMTPGGIYHGRVDFIKHCLRKQSHIAICLKLLSLREATRSEAKPRS